MKKEQMRELTKEELLQRKSELEEEQFNLRLQKGSKELDNPLRMRMLRRELARINTILREDRLNIRPLAQVEKETSSTEQKQE